MILKTSRLEIAVLILHMSIMRKNVKKGLKSNYGRDEGKEILQSFDSVKSTLEASFEVLEDDGKETELHFNVVEVNTLSSFVDWYTAELEVTFEATGRKVPEADQRNINTLKEIKDKIDQTKQQRFS